MAETRIDGITTTSSGEQCSKQDSEILAPPRPPAKQNTVTGGEFALKPANLGPVAVEIDFVIVSEKMCVFNTELCIMYYSV